jgi:hypothetical protein
MGKLNAVEVERLDTAHVTLRTELIEDLIAGRGKDFLGACVRISFRRSSCL